MDYEANRCPMNELARQRWDAQSTVPDSPGRWRRDGGYELCLGAVLAEAATAALIGPQDAAAFVGTLSATGDKRLIVEQLVRLGWPAGYVEAKIAENDLTPPHQRKALLRGRIDGLSDARLSGPVVRVLPS
jgi:hypothetical protein